MIYWQFNVFLPILTKTFFKIYENIIVRKKTEWSKLVPSLRTWDHAYRRNYCMDISFFEVFFPAGVLGLKIKWYNFSDSVKPYWSQYQTQVNWSLKIFFCDFPLISADVSKTFHGESLSRWIIECSKSGECLTRFNFIPALAEEIMVSLVRFIMIFLRF